MSVGLLKWERRKETGDIHNRHVRDNVSIVPGYAGHGYSKPTHYYLKVNGRTIEEHDHLAAAKESANIIQGFADAPLLPRR